MEWIPAEVELARHGSDFLAGLIPSLPECPFRGSHFCHGLLMEIFATLVPNPRYGGNWGARVSEILRRVPKSNDWQSSHQIPGNVVMPVAA